MANIQCGFDNMDKGVADALLLVDRGPTLKVNIGFDAGWNPKIGVDPQSSIKDIDALVDTGASESCIDNLLAVELGLPVIDRQPISGIAGTHMVNIYLAQFHVPALPFTMYGQFAGVDLKGGGIPQSALVGRTFLQHFKMLYEGKTGSVVLSSD